MRTLPSRVAVLAAALTLPLAACGGSSSDSGSSGSSSATSSKADVVIVASSLAYDKTDYTAKAGDVAIELDNRDPVEHNVTLVEGNRLIVEVNPKKQKTATINLPAGTYKVYCSVPGHNMKATITVS